MDLAEYLEFLYSASFILITEKFSFFYYNRVRLHWVIQLPFGNVTFNLHIKNSNLTFHLFFHFHKNHKNSTTINTRNQFYFCMSICRTSIICSFKVVILEPKYDGLWSERDQMEVINIFLWSKSFKASQWAKLCLIQNILLEFGYLFRFKTNRKVRMTS